MLSKESGFFLSTKKVIFVITLFGLILAGSIIATYFGKPNQKVNDLECSFLVCSNLNIFIDKCTTLSSTQKPTNSQIKISVDYWQSEPNRDIFLEKKSSLNFENSQNDEFNHFTIFINDSIKYQQMDGFGASLTDSSAWLLKYKLSDFRREEIFEELFGDSGIRIRLLRQPIGSTDFSIGFWSFSETENNTDDFSLNSFSMKPEDEYIRPMLEKALKISNRRIKLLASPWSPPAWMKTSKNLIGGSLRKECYDVYADYFIRYLQENIRKDSEIYGITIQNEPYYEPANYPGMKMNEQEQIEFTRVLGTKLKYNNLTTKILVHDHNFDGVDKAARIVVETNELVTGAGFHHYNDENFESLLLKFKDKVPDKDIWMTECGFGYWMGDPSEQFHKAVIRQLRTCRYWSKGFIMWNIALDEKSKPNVMGDNGSNRGLLQISSERIDDVKYETLFYALGHFSKFVDVNAYRIESNTFEQLVENVAFLNPDNTVVVVILQRTLDEKIVKFKFRDQSLNVKLPPMSASTFKFKISQ